MTISSLLLFCNEYTSLGVGPRFSARGFTSIFPRPRCTCHRHMLMGFEIDNNNGANCYRATAVFLPSAFGTFGTLQRLKWNERGEERNYM